MSSAIDCKVKKNTTRSNVLVDDVVVGAFRDSVDADTGRGDLRLLRDIGEANLLPDIISQMNISRNSFVQT